jgi:hypothetical protein
MRFAVPRWNTRLLPVTAVAVAACLVGCGLSTGSGQQANAQNAPNQATARMLRDVSAVASRVPPGRPRIPGSGVLVVGGMLVGGV